MRFGRTNKGAFSEGKPRNNSFYCTRPARAVTPLDVMHTSLRNIPGRNVHTSSSFSPTMVSRSCVVVFLHESGVLDSKGPSISSLIFRPSPCFMLPVLTSWPGVATLGQEQGGECRVHALAIHTSFSTAGAHFGSRAVFYFENQSRARSASHELTSVDWTSCVLGLSTNSAIDWAH